MITKQECEQALDNLYKVSDKLVLNHDIFIHDYDILKKANSRTFLKSTFEV